RRVGWAGAPARLSQKEAEAELELRGFGIAVASLVALFWAASGTQRERALLTGGGTQGAPELVRDREAAAAARPDDPEVARELAQAYLDAQQPGLALALLETAPRPPPPVDRSQRCRRCERRTHPAPLRPRAPRSGPKRRGPGRGGERRRVLRAAGRGRAAVTRVRRAHTRGRGPSRRDPERARRARRRRHARAPRNQLRRLPERHARGARGGALTPDRPFAVPQRVVTGAAQDLWRQPRRSVACSSLIHLAAFAFISRRADRAPRPGGRPRCACSRATRAARP